MNSDPVTRIAQLGHCLFDIERPYSRAVKARWTEGDLRRAVADARSIQEIIEKLGLIPAGGNYATMKEHFKKLAIDHFAFERKCLE